MSDEFAFACKLLMRREHSEGELRRKMHTKWPESDEIDSVVEKLLDEGLLSDQRYCALFIRSRVARMQGPRKIRSELSRKLVADAEIELGLEEADIDWRDLAGQWLSRQKEMSNDYELKAKYYRRLVNRGFTHNQAMDALNAR